jgi:Dolichyl-phosphate-mannose-protein mannosyltransferase
MSRIDAGPRMAIRYLVYIAIFTIICFLIQIKVGAYGSDHSQAGDESAHFVSSLMIADYFKHHLFSNPLSFAKAYYEHFPRVGLGHWPPMFEAVQAALFLVFGHRGTTAVALQAIIGGLCAGLAAAIVSPLGRVLGAITGVAVLFAPAVLFLVSTVMADNFLAVLVTLTALGWSAFYYKRTWSSALVFALLAAASILTKGTGFGLALMPVIYLGIKRDLWFLFDKKAIFAAVVVAILTIPWYLATYRLAATGFIYPWGWAYTRLAIPFFVKALPDSVGILIVACYIVGLYFSIATDDAGKEPLDIDVFVAASLSMLIIPMIAPADLLERYLIPALPSAAVVAAWGLQRLISVVPRSQIKRPLVRSSLWGAIVLLSLASVFHKPHLEPYHSGRIASYILDAHEANPLVLVSGAASVEGAVIAAFAERDHSWSHYVVRGTAVLASGNFSGTTYAERFDTPEAMAKWIRNNQIGWIVVQDPIAADAFPHDQILKAALDADLLGARLVQSVPNNRGGGSELRVYALPAAGISPSRSDPVFSELKPSLL